LKGLCTCIGCAVGLGLCIVSGGTATPLVTAALIGGGGLAGNLIGNKIERDEKKTRNREQELALRKQTIDNITKENQEANSEIEKLKKQHEENQEQKKKDQQELENAKNKANDPNLSEEERRYWRNKVIELENKMNRGDEEDRGILNRIKELQNKISNNNKTISSVSSGSNGKDKGI
jgi:predicted RNase H-like nuclease (RuvC/YqgF family)